MEQTHFFFLIPSTHQRMNGILLMISFKAKGIVITATVRMTYIDQGGKVV